MDIEEYILPLKKWWWLLVAAALVAGVTSYFFAAKQPPVYQAHTTLMVGQTIDNPNPNSGDFFLEQSLTGVYADMANREPVRNATMKTLGMNWLPSYTALPVPNSQLLEIQVTDSDPQRAMLIAAELARQLVLRSPSTASSADQTRQSFLNDQLNSLQSQITSTEKDVVNLQKTLGEMTSARQIQDTQGQINALQTKLGTLQSNYASLLANTQKGAVNSLTIIEAAELPTHPINQSKINIVLLAAAIGLLLASAGAYGMEFFDRTLKTGADVDRLMKLPMIGYIGEMADPGSEWKYFMQHPQTPIAEAFRSLRGNIEFTAVDQPPRTLYISSIQASAGKTTVAANLALAFLSGGKTVLLVDADPIRPRVHKFLDLPLSPGLMEVLTGGIDIHSVIRTVEDIPDLKVITAGALPEGISEPAFWKIDPTFSSLAKMADIVIVDGPPFTIPDGTTLTTKVDGMIIVIQPGTIRQEVAKAAIEQLRMAKARVFGIAFNRITHRDAELYSGNVYYSPYHSNGYHRQQTSAGQPLVMKLKDSLKKYIPQK